MDRKRKGSEQMIRQLGDENEDGKFRSRVKSKSTTVPGLREHKIDVKDTANCRVILSYSQQIQIEQRCGYKFVC